MALPILYTYRRCPYAMRARMALRYSGIAVEMREITFKDKPRHMLQASPKGTVPVLILEDGQVLEESMDIMHWALAQHDPDDWLIKDNAQIAQEAAELIAANDGDFKQELDRYKYAVRFPEQPSQVYRQQGEVFLQQLEVRLTEHACLCRGSVCIADIAIFPFIRQFAAVDAAWFSAAPYPALRQWLEQRTALPLFTAIMEKITPRVDAAIQQSSHGGSKSLN